MAVNMPKDNVVTIFYSFVLLVLQLVYYIAESAVRKIIPAAEKSIKDQVVVLTGAGSGIGRELAVRLARKGVKLALWDINKEPVEETALMTREYGVDSRAYVCDVADRQAVMDTAQKVQRDLGEVDILFNNAGIICEETITEASESTVRKVLEVNTVAHFWTLQAFLPSMMRRRHGHVITTASAGAKMGSPFLAPYCASKWAVYGLAECLKAELATLGVDGIYSTTVCPLIVNSPMVTALQKLRPVQRFGELIEPGEVADAVMHGFLRNHDMVNVPKSVYMFGIMRELLPIKAQSAFANFCKIRYKDTTKEN